MSQELEPSDLSNKDETGNSEKQNNINSNIENSDSSCNEQCSGEIESSDASNNEEIVRTPSEESDKDEIVYFEILPCEESSHEDESTQSDLENLVNVNVIYEFPDDDVETATFFDLSEDDNINFPKESSTESNSDDASILEEEVVNYHSHQAAATASQISPTVVSSYSRNHKDSENRTIKMEKEHSMKPSDTGITSQGSVQINKGLVSLSKNSQNVNGGKKRDFSQVTVDSKNEFHRRVKGRLLENNLHQQSKDSSVTASNSEDRFADIEDNADNSNGNNKDSLSNSKKFFRPRTNITTGSRKKKNLASCNADGKQSNDKKQFNDTVMHDNNFNLSEPSCSTSNNEPPTNNSKNIHPLKVKSKTTRKKGRRCHVCNKKLDLTAITCRCGGIYCAKHRYDKEHNCTFDYKAMGAKQIRKDNPQIIAEKISKI